MSRPSPSFWDDELSVLISLAISIGIIILTGVGWWTWKILAPIAQTMIAISPIEMP